ncbi:MAG: hypothetical protein HZA54_14000 [Planctomycetes bacterium]|nr:hypothetical protein [Planctomycetota bacterium]
MTPPRPRFEVLRSWFVIVACLGLVYLAQAGVDTTRDPDRLRDIPYLPNKHLLRALVVDFDLLTADLLWIAATEIALPTEHDPKQIDSAAWYYVLDTITDVDPYFFAVYRYGGSFLPKYLKDVARGNLLLEKGMRRLPDEWELGALASFNALHLTMPPDAERAVRYMELAAAASGAPQYIKDMAVLMHSQAGHTIVSMNGFLVHYRSTESQVLRKGYLDQIGVFAGEILDEAEGNPGERSERHARDLADFLARIDPRTSDQGDIECALLWKRIVEDIAGRVRAGRLREPAWSELLR